jgi:hypothetical protein
MINQTTLSGLKTFTRMSKGGESMPNQTRKTNWWTPKTKKPTTRKKAAKKNSTWKAAPRKRANAKPTTRRKTQAPTYHKPTVKRMAKSSPKRTPRGTYSRSKNYTWNWNPVWTPTKVMKAKGSNNPRKAYSATPKKAKKWAAKPTRKAYATPRRTRVTRTPRRRKW